MWKLSIILCIFTETQEQLEGKELKPELIVPDIVHEEEYFTNNLERLWDMLTLKSSNDIIAVTKHLGHIYDDAIAEGRFTWLDPIMRTYIVNPIPIAPDQRAWTKLVHYWIVNRKKNFGPEQNKLFELANRVLKKKDDEHLKAILEEFADFPKSNKTGRKLCSDLFEAFTRPFENEQGSIELKNLINILKNKYEVIETTTKFQIKQVSPKSLHHMVDVKKDRETTNDVKLNKLTSTKAKLSLRTFATRCTRGGNLIHRSHIKVEHNLGHGLYHTPFSFITIQTTTAPTTTLATAIPTTTIPTTTIPITTTSTTKETTRNIDHEPAYFSDAYQSWMRLLAVKNPEDVKTVHVHSDQIIQDMIKNDELEWLGKTMTALVVKIARSLSQVPVETLQEDASLFYLHLKNRRSHYNEEINDIIDYADSLVMPEDGQHLIDTIKEFEEFHTESKSGKKMCSDIIEAFQRPYMKLANTEALKELIDAASVVLKEIDPTLAR